MLAYQAVYGDEIKLVKVYDLNPDSANAMAERIMKEMSINAIACMNPEQAANADIVVTTTPSRKPVLKLAPMEPGRHQRHRHRAPGNAGAGADTDRGREGFRQFRRAGIAQRRDQLPMERGEA